MDVINTIKNKQILYIVKHSLPSIRGGYTVRTDNMVKGLMENNEVFVISLVSNNELNSDMVEYNGITYYNLNLNCIKENDAMLKLTELVDQLIEKYNMIVDIVIGSSNYQVANLAYDVSKIINVKFWYDVRGFWELSAVSNGKYSKTSNWFSRYLSKENNVYEKADKIIAITNQVRDELIGRYFDGSKIVVIENFIHRSNLIKIRKKLNFKSEFVIGYFGSLCIYEGLDDLIGVIPKLNTNVSLVIAGNIENSRSNYKTLKKLVEDKNLETRVEFKTNIDYCKIQKLYEKVDLICIPRKNTEVSALVSPIKLIEALSYGVNVLTSDMSPMLDISKKYPDQHHIYKVGDMSDMTIKLKYIIKKYNVLN
jgi:glycosyltransferase involved in cell wall biosynthesis